MSYTTGSSNSWRGSSTCPGSCPYSYTDRGSTTSFRNYNSWHLNIHPPAPSTTKTAAPALSMTLPPTLLGLIRDIHRDFGPILRRFDRLGKKVESMDQRLIHIEGIVDPSHAPIPRVVLDILASNEDEESDEDA